MIPISWENKVLLVLREAIRTGDRAALTITEAHRLTTMPWRTVARTMLYLEREGLVYVARPGLIPVAGKYDLGSESEPAYAMTPAGIGKANRARRQGWANEQRQESTHAAS